MKHRGSVIECSEERMEELMRAYDRCMEEAEYIRLPEIYRAAAESPSSRFWVSDIRAALVVSSVLRGEDPLSGMWPTKREMYTEILRRVEAMRKEDPSLSVSEACSAVVMQPAPKFYITPGTAKVMICRHRKEWIRKKRERLYALL